MHWGIVILVLLWPHGSKLLTGERRRDPEELWERELQSVI